MLLLAEAAHHSKTAFYIGGGLLALWAVILSAVGLNRPEFPGRLGRVVVLVSVLLVAGAMTTAVASD